MQIVNMKNYSPGAIANYFLKKSWKENHLLTPMQLQKLMYFANGWYMAFYNNEGEILPLINEPFQAWEYGPVCSSVYHEFKGFGNNVIPKNYLMKEVRISEDLLDMEIVWNEVPAKDLLSIELLEKIWSRYSSLTAFQLSEMTHLNDEKNPWRIARSIAKNEGIIRGKEINNEHIKTYFKKLLDENRAY